MRRYEEMREWLEENSSTNPVADNLYRTILKAEVYRTILKAEERGESQEVVMEDIRRSFVQAREAFTKAHEALNRATVKHTGMTLGDYVWIRDYAPPGDEK